MATINQIIKALKTTREEFKNIFLQAQTGLPGERVPLESITLHTDDKKAFREALRHAESHGWLENIVDIVIHEGLETGELARIVTKAVARKTKDVRLQAITNVAGNFSIPDVVYRGIANGMKWTGKLLIDGNPVGTGILIGPNHFLTAWHVTEPLFSKNRSGKWEAKPSSHSRLKVVFDDFLSFLSRGNHIRHSKTQTVDVHPQWCVTFSPCNEKELAKQLPANLQELKGHWDYVVIRLSNAIGLHRRWAPLDAKAVVPRATDKIVVFQHPAGQPLKIDNDTIADPKPIKTEAVPAYRFLHYVNSGAGSSGGPCFDKGFMLFGLHQGEWIKPRNGERPKNRGIPIVRILEHIKEEIKGLPALDPAENAMWKLSNLQRFVPVINLEEFQGVVWRSAITGQPKLVRIAGERGKGKTFCVDLLHAMLADGDHLKLKLPAETFSKLSVQELVGKIYRMAALPERQFSSPAELSSTVSVWLKSEVLAGLMNDLETVRNGRMVWLCITELNKFDIEGEHTSEFLFMLYEQSLRVDWLRIVLDGVKADIPATLTDLTETSRVREFARQNIETFFKRAIAELELAVDNNVLQTDVDECWEDYEEFLIKDESTAAAELSKKISKRITLYIKHNQ